MKPISFIAGNKSRLLLLAAVATGVLGMQAGRGTLAFFTTSVGSSANVFTAGSLKFNINDTVGTGTGLTSVTSSISFTNAASGGLMKPGDKIYAPISISNIGTLDAVYGLSYFGTHTNGDLIPGLNLAIKRGPSQAACVSTNWTAGTEVALTTPIDAPLIAGGTSLSPTVIQAVSSAVTGGAAAAGIPLARATVAGPTGTPTIDNLCLEVTFINDLTPATQNTYNSTSGFDTTITFTFDALVAAGLKTDN
ncbi:MAG TPA: hypothetical protein VKV73_13915 [Chloroflexota bacterium]|nr:hypothetical protein [Chloroflexota bacterium]